MIVLPTRDRYERLLTRSNAQVEDRTTGRTAHGTRIEQPADALG
jgi:hypothetical protein